MPNLIDLTTQECPPVALIDIGSLIDALPDTTSVERDALIDVLGREGLSTSDQSIESIVEALEDVGNARTRAALASFIKTVDRVRLADGRPRLVAPASMRS
ncbi:MAG: hypothetical protein AAGC53_20055 [Actinomycetota bacterium]